jgi:hypothetical protein
MPLAPLRKIVGRKEEKFENLTLRKRGRRVMFNFNTRFPTTLTLECGHEAKFRDKWGLPKHRVRCKECL